VENKIIELTKLWYEIVSTDHHKDRDCHWYVNKVWSYGHKPYYRVEHYGYIGKETYDNDFDTYLEAQNFLHDTLIEFIEDEKKWAKEVLETKQDGVWGEDQKERAEEILKIIEKGDDDH
jgi:hypothetical protein